jgi:hypothetical protein
MFASKYPLSMSVGDSDSPRSFNGLPAVARQYTHAPVPNGMVLCVEYDGSLVGDSRGFNGISFHQLEVKTRPVNGFAEASAVVKTTVELMAFLGCQVNRSCGLRVHLDARHEVTTNPKFIRSLLNLAYRFEPVIFGLVPPSRRTCGYARTIPDLREHWSRCRSMRCYRRLLNGWDRYVGLNASHLTGDNPRVEFRWAGGSLNGGRILHWVAFLNRLMDCAFTRNCQTPREQVANTRHGLQKTLVTLGLLTNTRVWKVAADLAPTRRFLIQRWKHFNTDQLKKRGCSNRCAVAPTPEEVE